MTNVRPAPEPSLGADEVIDIAALLGALWREFWTIAAVTAAFFIGAIIYLNAAIYTYTAELKVTPVQASGGGASALGGLAGLASIAGVTLPQSSGASSFQLYTESLKSRSVAEALASRPDLMRKIFESEWDKARGRFVQPTRGPVGSAIQAIKHALGLPVYEWVPPGPARLQAYLDSKVNVIQNTKSSVVTITFEHPDPEFAITFLNAVHRALDTNLRRKALQRANQYIAYLSSQLQRVTLVEHRMAISEALSEQEKTRMMANSRLAFAAEPFGPATASLVPTSPKPIAVLAISIVLGLISGIALALIRNRFRRPSARPAGQGG